MFLDFLDKFCRNTTDDSAWLHIFCHYSPGRKYRAVAYRHPRSNGYISPDPYILTDMYWLECH